MVLRPFLHPGPNLQLLIPDAIDIDGHVLGLTLRPERLLCDARVPRESDR